MAPPRIAPVDAGTADPSIKPLFDEVRARGGEPVNLHRTLANAPELLAPFLNLAFALRAAPVAPRVDRELVILRTLQLTDGAYGFAHHRGMGLSFGLTEAQLGALAGWRESALFSDRERALLAYTDAIFSAGGVDDEAFAELARVLQPREIVEVTLTATFYANVAYLTRALRIPVDEDAGDSRYGR